MDRTDYQDTCTRLPLVAIIRQLAPRNETKCEWCGKSIELNVGQGRKRKYCGPSCKQRAYEQRVLLAGTGVDADSVILSKKRVDEIRDQLFELRCAAEDISVAAAEGADEDDLRLLCDELVDLARRLEKLR